MKTLQLSDQEIRIMVEALDYQIGLMQGNDQENHPDYEISIDLEEKLHILQSIVVQS